ncbi:transposase family protein [Gilliamella intestini]|uniref:Integrase core domain-containing protein n=1 Tax=Gilliamella intestini TaxID=1798183 RepID=A0A1C3ZRW7_9GAMM|nr:transposase family protein [Gilliamella intestini]SCB84970.1 Integrase core domain-containing protein [Gilliamella intestini]
MISDNLFIGIDDFSCELYAGIYPDKSQFSAAQFLQNDVLAQCPYTTTCIYSDNGREYQGASEHLFVKTCHSHRINQKFTKLTLPTNEWESRKSDMNFELRCT